MDRGALGFDGVFDSMLGLQSGEVGSCDLRKVGEELVALISWLGNGAEVQCWGSCFTKWRGKMCFSVHMSFNL